MLPPQDLKQEIKHTLQNKLHRNAGPEDLVAAEAMLQRVVSEWRLRGRNRRDGRARAACVHVCVHALRRACCACACLVTRATAAPFRRCPTERRLPTPHTHTHTTTTDSDYSQAFVHEFKVFVAELREFFNAAGLADLLLKVRDTLGPEDQQVRARVGVWVCGCGWVWVRVGVGVDVCVCGCGCGCVRVGECVGGCG
jgi:hypothetical protein